MLPITDNDKVFSKTFPKSRAKLIRYPWEEAAPLLDMSISYTRVNDSENAYPSSSSITIHSNIIIKLYGRCWLFEQEDAKDFIKKTIVPEKRPDLDPDGCPGIVEYENFPHSRKFIANNAFGSGTLHSSIEFLRERLKNEGHSIPYFNFVLDPLQLSLIGPLSLLLCLLYFLGHLIFFREIIEKNNQTLNFPLMLYFESKLSSVLTVLSIIIGPPAACIFMNLTYNSYSRPHFYGSITLTIAIVIIASFCLKVINDTKRILLRNANTKSHAKPAP